MVGDGIGQAVVVPWLHVNGLESTTQTITTSACTVGPAAVAKVKGKKARIAELERRVAELEARLAKVPQWSYTDGSSVPWWQAESWW